MKWKRIPIRTGPQGSHFMNRTFLVGLTLISLTSSSPLMAMEPREDPAKKSEDSKANPQAKLDTAIKKGIELLESKKHKEFVMLFAPREALKKVQDDNKLDEMVEFFGKEKASSLLEVLKAIKDKKPKLENDGAKAVFDLEPGRYAKDKVSFSRTKGLWYIDN